MTQNPLTLADYGWSAYFQSQIELAELEETVPARVLAVHRNGLDVAGPGIEARCAPITEEDNAATAGDWLILDRQSLRPRRILERRSLFKRRAAGPGRARLQLIAANIDTLFIVSSCQLEFNIAGLERHLAFAHEAEVTPAIVLTKADLARDVSSFAEAGLRLGAGKPALPNTLGAAARQATGATPRGDQRGRPTTAGRSRHLPSGGRRPEMPGPRELGHTGAAPGIGAVFGDIAALGAACRFGERRHDSEPGCAVRTAIEAGYLDKSRPTRYLKQLREDARNSESLAETGANAFGRNIVRPKDEEKPRGQA